MKVSVTVIVRDGMKYLPSCLASLKPVSDDIVVVVDDRTTDSTAEYARKFGTRVFFHKFTDFSDQHNFADSKTENNWVLSIDADETVSNNLANEILSLPQNTQDAYFRIPRKNKIFGKIIHHSNWDPDGLIRLYNKTLGDWKGEVHEQFMARGSYSNLSGVICHDNYRTVSEFISRQNEYSSLSAENLIKQHQHFNFIKAFISAKYEFLRRFIWHAGWLDGWHGLFLAYLMSVYQFSVWIKLWEKSKSVGD